MCQYPNCKNKATHNWALVPLCGDHHEDIRLEAYHFYRRKIRADEREIYQKIKHLTPWE